MRLLVRDGIVHFMMNLPFVKLTDDEYNFIINYLDSIDKNKLYRLESILSTNNDYRKLLNTILSKANL